MGRAEREQHVTGAIERYNAGDFEAASRMVGPELILHRRSDAPEGDEVIRGTAAIEAMLKPITFAEQHAEVLETEHAGEALLALTHFTARGAGSGVPVDAHGAVLWEFAGDKPVRVHMFQDVDGARDAFEALAT